tara:strand:+ start:1131 stop:2963 length:1833 start_codon:yes stop_codon:yes gene_type:complete
MGTKIQASNLHSNVDTHVTGLVDSDHVKNRTGLFNQNSLKVPSFDSAGKAGLTPANGMMIYNSTINLMQYYASNEWKSIDSPPTITSITPSTFDATNDTITVNGTGFASGAVITCVATNGSTFACTTTFVSSTRVTFVPTSAMVSDSGANDKFSIRITNASGLASADLVEALDFSATPTFTTAAGSLGNIYETERGSKTFTIAATGADPQDTLSFAVTAGSLPSNMSMSTSGVISGTPTQVSAGQTTTSTFTVTCTATSAENNSITKTNTREFSIAVKGLIENTFSYVSNATQTWTPPADLTSATVAMWGGGGGAYAVTGGNYANGGAGGFVESTINILPTERNQNWQVVVAQGGQANGYGGYGGGNGGANGGSGGGGASFLLSPTINLSTNSGQPFESSLTYGGGNGIYEPTSEFIGKTMATHIVLIAAGGGGAGWYNLNNRHGGAGGGIDGGNGISSNGATQSAGGAGSGTGTSGSKFRGGQETANQSNGGSGGGGGGFYGGGVTYGGSGANNGGGGGSSFIGFADGSTSTVLTSNASNDSYTDTSTRTNGTRTYTNSKTTRGAGDAVRTPAETSNTYYDTGSGVGTAYGARDGYTERGGHGFVSIRY